MNKGLFITFEGIDGCGKTTQINKLKEKLKHRDKEFIFLREPGGTEIGEQIREILLDNNKTDLWSRTELLLYSASRSQLYHEKITTYLERGKIVICDRFFDSTLAYQGYGRGLEVDFIEKLNKFVTEGLTPDITFLLDISIEESLNRLNILEEKDRLENEDKKFYKNVRKGFLELAEKYENRFFTINGENSEHKISNLIWKKIKKEI